MSAVRYLLIALTILSAPLITRGDGLNHLEEDTFAAEAQRLAPAILAQPAPPLPPEANNSLGAWGPVFSWTPHIPVSAAQLPDGRLLTFASNERTTFPFGSEFTYAAVWDPTTGSFTEYNHPSHDMFCGSIVNLPDGLVLVNGGRNFGPGSSIFDWRINQWRRIQDMQGGRWYPASVALPDGEVFTVGGAGTGSNSAERWNSANGWNLLTGINWGVIQTEPGYVTDWSPFLTLAPDGRILHFGPTDIMHWITWPGAGSMTISGTDIPGTHYPKEGAWVMYDEGRLLIAGGGVNSIANTFETTTGTSTKAAYTINLSTAPPTVASTAPMENARQFSNAVVLPNGEVMVVGGNTSGLKFSDIGSVFASEIWNPESGRWRTVASLSVPRSYHSVALLMPDGRVLAAGGGLGGNAADHQDAQLYTPPMLFSADGSLATRPTLISAPQQIGQGTVFEVSGTPGLSKFAFIKLSAITHTINTDLRYLSLPFAETSPGNYAVTARANLNVMTPGYWMLFGLLPSGTWSVAKIVQVEATSHVSIVNPGNRTSFLNTVASLHLVFAGPSASPRTYSATGLPLGLALDALTGIISGTLTGQGIYNVHVSVSGAAGTAEESFIWTVSPPSVVENFVTFPNADQLTLSGSAIVKDGVLRLTENSASQTGSAYLTAPIAIGANSSFTTRFVFRQHATLDGAEGMAFVLQGRAAAALGTGGSGLGYGGISESLGVEIDTNQDLGDADANHLGIVIHGDIASHIESYTPSFDLEDEGSHTVWIEYDGPADTLRVYLAQGIVETRPTLPVMTHPNLDLASITGGMAWFGFAGATGLRGNNHDISAWSLMVNANALPASPQVTNPGSRISVVQRRATLQMQAGDINGDLLIYSAVGLPAGMTIDPTTGLVSGVPTVAGVNNVTVSVEDGLSAPVSVSFVWTIDLPLSAQSMLHLPVAAGASMEFFAHTLGSSSPQYKWNFGDGSPETGFSSSSATSHIFATPGRYLVTMTARDAIGIEVTSSYYQGIHAPLTALKPARSSSIVCEERGAGHGRVWCVNPDNNSVSVFDVVTRSRLAEINVGVDPRSLAVAPDGRIWVANAGSSTISVVDTAALVVASILSLPRASHPFGIAFSPNGASAWVACEESGQLIRLNPIDGVQVSTTEVGQHVRQVSISSDSATVFVSRFITPPLPGECTANPRTEDAGGIYGGEIVVVNGTTGEAGRKIVLQHSERPNTAASAQGIPNYVGAVSIAPDGQSAWVPSKQDNIKCGVLRIGQPLTHDLAVRSIVSRLDLTGGIPATDDRVGRVDFDDSGVPTASCFDSSGLYLFTTLEGSRLVTVTDSWSKAELLRFNVGRAPQGLAISSDNLTLYVHNYLDRNITAYDISSLLHGAVVTPSAVGMLNCVTIDLVSDSILKGKQIFYDSQSEKLALGGYLSCASCHNDGGQDGRVWDFTQFGEGLRNTIPLRGRGGMAHGPLHWTGNFDEVQDFEGQIRGFAGGLGLMSDADFHTGTRNNPLGDAKAGLSADLDALAAYVSSLGEAGSSPERNADGSLTTSALAGKAVFQRQNCASCHSGARFTDSAPGLLRNVGTIKPSSGQRLGASLVGLDTPTLRGLWNSEPYLHDGSASSLRDAVSMHSGINLNAKELANLSAYLRQIDDAELSAPLDSTAPSIYLSTPSVSVATSFTITVVCSESVMGLESGDFIVSNGTVSNFSGSGATYVLTLMPAAEGSVSVSLSANRCFDLSANGNLPSNVIDVDYAPPIPAYPGLNGDYYIGENFDEFVFRKVDPRIFFSWPFESPGPGMPNDHFSVRWTGKVTPIYSETYTFFLSSDDGVRLWVDGVLLIDAWVDQTLTAYQGTIALTGGVPVDIRIEYYEKEWGAGIELEWQSASQVRQVIPSQVLATAEERPAPVLSTSSSEVSAPFSVEVNFTKNVTGLSAEDFAVRNGSVSEFGGSGATYSVKVTPVSAGIVVVNVPAGGCVNRRGIANVGSNTVSVTYAPLLGGIQSGLRGDYFSGKNFETRVLTRLDRTVDFSWPFESPAPEVPPDSFSVRWVGRVTPVYSETYNFITTSDDGVRLWVNGHLLIDAWQDQAEMESEAGIALTAGIPVDIRIEYYENEWGARMKLEWQSTHQLRQVVPAQQLATGMSQATPTLTVEANATQGPFIVKSTFGKSVTGLATSDFVVVNGTASLLSGTGGMYMLSIVGVGLGEIFVSLPADVCVDTDGVGNVASNTIRIRSDASPYQEWKAAHFDNGALNYSEVAGELADPDRDGLPNLLEYAFNGDPLLGAESYALVTDVVETNGTDFIYLYFHRNREATDVQISFEACSDLQAWIPVTAELVSSTVIDSTTSWDTMRIPVAAVPYFVRLRVTK